MTWQQTEIRLAAAPRGFHLITDTVLDQALQTATGKDALLAGKSTLCRMEQAMDRQTIVKAHELLWHHFIEQHDAPPKEIVLDFDGTDIPVHGDQPGKFFNQYYDHHCYFPRATRGRALCCQA